MQRNDAHSPPRLPRAAVDVRHSRRIIACSIAPPCRPPFPAPVRRASSAAGPCRPAGRARPRARAGGRSSAGGRARSHRGGRRAGSRAGSVRCRSGRRGMTRGREQDVSVVCHERAGQRSATYGQPRNQPSFFFPPSSALSLAASALIALAPSLPSASVSNRLRPSPNAATIGSGAARPAHQGEGLGRRRASSACVREEGGEEARKAG
jgi:hypothetical protein